MLQEFFSADGIRAHDLPICISLPEHYLPYNGLRGNGVMDRARTNYAGARDSIPVVGSKLSSQMFFLLLG